MLQINWKLKAFLYKLFSLMRLKSTYYFLQKHITKRSGVDIRDLDKLWVHHADSIEENGIKSVLEVGAGKDLGQNIYISYRFNNSITQTAIDINDMIDFDLINKASEQIANLLKLDKKKDKVTNLEQLKNLYNINYLAPYDLKKFKNSNVKFEMCISTTALEHFTNLEIVEYLQDLKTILKKDGFVSSVIDYSDHYSHTDKNISSLNYLIYSNEEWEKYNNSYLFQNRLRHQDYKKIFETNGYKIKKTFLGNSIEPPLNISYKFDINNKETFIGWAYFLISR
jgi:hypothetical protein